MKAIDFPERTLVIAKDQPQYQPLPAKVNEDGSIVTVWELSQEEISHLQLYGRLYLKILTDGKGVQPVFLTVNKNEVLGYGEKSHKNPNETQTETQKKPNPFSDTLHACVIQIASVLKLDKDIIYKALNNIKANDKFSADDREYLKNHRLVIPKEMIGCSYLEFTNMIIEYTSFDDVGETSAENPNESQTKPNPFSEELQYAVGIMNLKTGTEPHWFYDVISKVKDQNELRQDDIDRMSKLGVEFEPRRKGCDFALFQQLLFNLTGIEPNSNPNESQK